MFFRASIAWMYKKGGTLRRHNGLVEIHNEPTTTISGVSTGHKVSMRGQEASKYELNGARGEAGVVDIPSYFPGFYLAVETPGDSRDPGVDLIPVSGSTGWKRC